MTENETKERVTAFVFNSFENLDDDFKKSIHDNRPEKTLPSDAFRDPDHLPFLIIAKNLARSAAHNPNIKLDERLLTTGSYCMVNAFLQCLGPVALKMVDVENLKAALNKAYTSLSKLPGEPQSIGRINASQLETFLSTKQATTVLQNFGLRVMRYDHEVVTSNEKLKALGEGWFCVKYKQLDGDCRHWVAVHNDRGQQVLYETARGYGIGADRNLACIINGRTLDFLQFSEPCEVVSVKFDDMSPIKKLAPIVDAIPLAVPVHSNNPVSSFDSWNAELLSKWVSSKTTPLLGKLFLDNEVTGRVMLELSAEDLSVGITGLSVDQAKGLQQDAKLLLSHIRQHPHRTIA